MDTRRVYELLSQLHALIAGDHPDRLSLTFTELVERYKPCRHGPDFASIVWHGTPYTFTANQSAAIAVLWRAWENGTPDVRHETLLSACDKEGGSLRDVFKEHAAWQTLIVTKSKGTYRLAEPEPPTPNP